MSAAEDHEAVQVAILQAGIRASQPRDPLLAGLVMLARIAAASAIVMAAVCALAELAG